MAGGGPLRIERDGAVMRVRLDRPSARNAVDLATCVALRETFESLDADPDVRVVLICAQGPAFCAGADLKERHGKDANWVRRRRLAAFAAYTAIERCSKPVVALVHGAVVGSGGEIALAADFAIAASDASFRFPEPQWGTVGATQRLQRAIGKRRAKELLFTGRAMPAAEALALGLVARVVDPADLARVGGEIAAGIAAAPPLALRLTKRAIDLGSETDLENGIRIELAAIEHNHADGEWSTGVEKFTATVGQKEKR
jgi:enoyl-CoA hydratase/carnithine racemase